MSVLYRNQNLPFWDYRLSLEAEMIGRWGMRTYEPNPSRRFPIVEINNKHGLKQFNERAESDVEFWRRRGILP